MPRRVDAPQPLRDQLQFAHVLWPRVLRQQAPGLRSQHRRLPPALPGAAQREVLQQHRHIAPTLAQRRNLHLEAREPPRERRVELPPRHQPGHRRGAGRDDPHVHGLLASLPGRRRTSSEHPGQPLRRGPRERIHVAQQQRARIRPQHRGRHRRLSGRPGAAEERHLHRLQGLAALHHHPGPQRARRTAMEMVRQQRLARAWLAMKDHRRGTPRRPPSLVQHAAKPARGPERRHPRELRGLRLAPRAHRRIGLAPQAPQRREQLSLALGERRLLALHVEHAEGHAPRRHQRRAHRRVRASQLLALQRGLQQRARHLHGRGPGHRRRAKPLRSAQQRRGAIRVERVRGLLRQTPKHHRLAGGPQQRRPRRVHRRGRAHVRQHLLDGDVSRRLLDRRARRLVDDGHRRRLEHRDGAAHAHPVARPQHRLFLERQPLAVEQRAVGGAQVAQPHLPRERVQEHLRVPARHLVVFQRDVTRRAAPEGQLGDDVVPAPRGRAREQQECRHVDREPSSAPRGARKTRAATWGVRPSAGPAARLR